MSAMRLSNEQVRAILTAARELAGPGASVRLFGSRLRDDVRGGDIDLLVECPAPVDGPVLLAARITARLQRLLGDRRIDVLVVDPHTLLDPVHRVALAEGVRLEP
jgi:predicted nucleotidyltransferase